MSIIHCYPIDATYKIINKRIYLLIFARTEDKKKICLIETDYKPYFYVQAIKKEITHLIGDLRTEYIKGKGTKIYLDHPDDIEKLSNFFESLGYSVSETDLPFVRKYFLGNDLSPLCLTEVEIEPYPMNIRVPSYQIKSIKTISYEILDSPNIFFISILRGNAYDKNSPITHIAILGKGINKIFSWKSEDKERVHKLASESDLLETFLEIIEKNKPDFICGYFMDDIFASILERAKIYRLDLKMGIDNSYPIYTEKHKSYKINGINVFDCYKFIRRFLKTDLDDFSIESIARYIVKEDIYTGDDLLKRLSWEVHILNALFADLYIYLTELVKPTGVVPYYINRQSIPELIDWLIVREVYNLKKAVPKKKIKKRAYEHMHSRYLPKTGIYHNTWKIRIKNLSLSLISHENVSPERIDCGCCMRKRREDRKHWFCSWKKGFFSSIAKNFIERYNRIEDIFVKSKENKRLKIRLEVYDMIAYALPDYIYNPSSRWYLKEMRDAFNELKQDAIDKIVEIANNNSIKTAYADTRKIIVYDTDKDKIETFSEQIYREMHGNVEMITEDNYQKTLIVYEGCKLDKKPRFAYLTTEGEMILKGFNDFPDGWTPMIKDAEKRIVELIVKEGDLDHAVGYVNYLIKRIRSKEIPAERMIQRILIRKDPNEYEEDSIIGKVIKKMKERDIEVRKGIVASYIIDDEKGELLDKVKLPDETSTYDSDYYVNEHLISQIFCFFSIFGINLTKDNEGKVITQTTLKEFGQKR